MLKCDDVIVLVQLVVLDDSSNVTGFFLIAIRNKFNAYVSEEFRENHFAGLISLSYDHNYRPCLPCVGVQDNKQNLYPK